MNNLCRVISFSILFTTPFGLFASRDAAKPAPKTKFIAFVGNYTNKTDSKGIYAFRFDATTGKMSVPGLAAETKDPSWVVVHRNGKFLYAANEMGKPSTVSAFSIDSKTAKLTFLNSLPALGEDPCHLSFDRTGNFLLSANYTSGNVVVYPILADGKLGEPTANVTDQGSTGPDTKRQDHSHAHWIAASGLNRFVYVSDLGLDRVLVYKFDSFKGTLAPFSDSAIARPGSGPRHVAWSHDARHMYVLGELDSTVTVFANDGEKFTSIQSIPMLPAGFSGRNDAAEIELHPSGKFLYASNRGEDSIVVYAIDQKSGKLTVVEDVPTGGKEPRHFAIDPTGKFLLAENQNTNNIVEFKIDLSTGKLTPTGEVLNVPSPICLAFLPLE